MSETKRIDEWTERVADGLRGSIGKTVKEMSEMTETTTTEQVRFGQFDEPVTIDLDGLMNRSAGIELENVEHAMLKAYERFEELGVGRKSDWSLFGKIVRLETQYELWLYAIGHAADSDEPPTLTSKNLAKEAERVKRDLLMNMNAGQSTDPFSRAIAAEERQAKSDWLQKAEMYLS